MTKNNCANRNHRRSTPPVRVCPNCGVVVNASIAVKNCSETDHSLRRKKPLSIFCYDCGKRIVG